MNNDLISRSALKKAICIDDIISSDETWEQLYDAVVNHIDNAPTVPLPGFKEGYKQAILDGKTNFSRPQGEWIDHSEDGYVKCPFCGRLTTCEGNKEELHYCWNCGAKMKGGKE